MPETPPSLLSLSAARGDWVRLRTLISLRWLAVTGQAITVLVAELALGFDLPIGACFGVIAASVCVNIVAQIIYPENKRLSERDTALFLLFDLAQLGALLFFTGGLTNPFAVFLLAPVIISATALTLRSAMMLGGFAAVELTLLAWLHLPLTLPGGAVHAPTPLIMVGNWVALLIALAFLAGYARRVTAENFNMSLALSAAQEALSREQRLTAIGGLAAAAAHELGTPLATIMLASGELADEIGDDPDLAEDVDLIRKQAERCREILRDLARGGKDDSQVKTAPISAIVEEAAEPHRDRGKRIVLRLRGSPLAAADLAAQPVVLRKPELVHGLRNLVQNAVDFAEAVVWVDLDWTDRDLRIAVGDDGPGYRANLLGRLGDPYVRGRARRPGAKPPPKGPGDAGGGDGRAGYEGMGLGLFIAKTLLERTGARIEFANGADADARAQARRGARAAGTGVDFARPSGAIVAAVWPRDALDPPEGLRRGKLDANRSFSLSNI